MSAHDEFPAEGEAGGEAEGVAGESPVAAAQGITRHGAEGFAASPKDESLMAQALKLARAGASQDEVPVGALVVGPKGKVLGRGHNRRALDSDPSAHAEVVALREAAAARGTWRLWDCTLVVTLEPCIMCAGAAMAARLDRVVFGAWDTKAGACGSVWDLPRDRRALHRIEIVGGVAADACAGVLAEFFAARRAASARARP